jgi:hypothetical protein
MSKTELDAATTELLRQAEQHASAMESEISHPPPNTCAAHGKQSYGVALSLRLLCVLARKESLSASPWKWGASLGVPTPVCALFFFIGKSKGWW